MRGNAVCSGSSIGRPRTSPGKPIGCCYGHLDVAEACTKRWRQRDPSKESPFASLSLSLSLSLSFSRAFPSNGPRSTSRGDRQMRTPVHLCVYRTHAHTHGAALKIIISWPCLATEVSFIVICTPVPRRAGVPRRRERGVGLQVYERGEHLDRCFSRVSGSGQRGEVRKWKLPRINNRGWIRASSGIRFNFALLSRRTARCLGSSLSAKGVRFNFISELPAFTNYHAQKQRERERLIALN